MQTTFAPNGAKIMIHIKIISRKRKGMVSRESSVEVFSYTMMNVHVWFSFCLIFICTSLSAVQSQQISENISISEFNVKLQFDENGHFIDGNLTIILTILEINSLLHLRCTNQFLDRAKDTKSWIYFANNAKQHTLSNFCNYGVKIYYPEDGNILTLTFPLDTFLLTEDFHNISSSPGKWYVSFYELFFES